MSLGRILWGIFIIFVGTVLLLTNYGYLDSSIWGDIWRLWPVILIIAGLSILSKSISQSAKTIVDVIIILLIVAGLIYVILPNNQLRTRMHFLEQSPSPDAQEQVIDEELSGSDKPIYTVVKTGAIDLNISGSTDKLAAGKLISDFSSLEINRSSSEQEDKLEIISNLDRNRVFTRGRNRLELSLNDRLPLSLELNTGALSGNLDLSGLNLKNLLIKTGASSYNITLGDKSDISGELNIGASSINLRVPGSVGLRFISQSGLTSNNFTSEGLSKSGEEYTSENYDSAERKIDLIFKAGASSITLDRF